MMYKKTCIFILLLIISSLFWNCANPVAPEGGPKDTKAPKILECNPPNFTTNFKENTIKIDFNEFIAIKNQSEEVNVSPPLNHPPDIKLRGKSLLVKLEDTLAPNTTYSIDFGKSISDITEGNALTGLSYVFSTGPYIDSLSLRGTVINAFDLGPQKDIFALLYIDRYDTIVLDSLPLKVKPYYVTKTNEKGEFLFHNLKSAPMKLTALADLNGNLIFDQATEKVAFSDSIVHPYFIPKPKVDTTGKNDSLKARIDSSGIKMKDSVQQAKKVKSSKDSTARDTLQKQFPIPNNLLKLFEDVDSVQRIEKSVFLKRGLVLLSFRFPAKNISIKPLNCDTSKPWALKEYSNDKDSLYLWLTNPQTDSLILRVVHENKVLDTVKLELFSKDAASLKKKDQGKIFLGVNQNTYSGQLNQFAGNLTLTFSSPLSSGKLNRIFLIQDKDTLKPKIFFGDSIKRRLSIVYKWKEDKSYSVFIPDSVFTGINGLSNDTIRFGFKTQQARDFGNLVLEIDISKYPGDYVIQLLNERNLILCEKIINSSGKIEFEYLIPGKFRIKAIKDRNHNGRWDTGNFRKKIQPEEVFFLPKLIEIRANWDVEESWAPSVTF